jgi:hypothetical protein
MGTSSPPFQVPTLLVNHCRRQTPLVTRAANLFAPASKKLSPKAICTTAVIKRCFQRIR